MTTPPDRHYHHHHGRGRTAASGSVRPRRRPARVLAITLALLGLGTAIATPATAESHVSVERATGTDRYAAARRAALRAFPGGTTHAVLARGDLYADALAGSRVAGLDAGPILLTPSDSLHVEALQALIDLGVTHVTLLGGTVAITQGVEDSLVGLGYVVERIAGTDRFATAAAIASQGPVGGAPGHVRTAIVTSGRNYPDALAAGPIAYREGFPLLLTEPDTLPLATQQALQNLGIDHVVVLGGPAAVAYAVDAEVAALGITVERIQGATRYDTAALIADYERDALGWPREAAVLATGTDFANAIAAGPLGGVLHAPILLAGSSGVPAATQVACAHFDIDRVLVVADDTTPVPYYAQQACRIEATGGEAWAWLWADQKSAAAYTPALEYQANSAWTDATIARTAPGTYTVTIPGIDVSDGVVHVSPVAHAGRCGVDGWTGAGPAEMIYVSCVDPAGAASDAMFTLYFRQAAVGAGPVAYGWVSWVVDSYSMLDNYTYNSAGLPNGFITHGVGDYTVVVPGSAATGGTVLVSAYGGGDARCHSRNWFPDGPDQKVRVQCNNSAGHPVDSLFDWTFGYGSAIAPSSATKVGYTWVSDATATDLDLTASDYSYNSAGGAVTSHRHGPGLYTITFDGLSGVGPSNVQVTPYGIDSTDTCSVEYWGGVDAEVTVQCYDIVSNPADTRFVVQYMG